MTRMERLWRHGLAGMLILATTAVHHAGEADPAPAEAGLLRITYVGNEGFLIEGDGSKVMIDAAYRGGVPGYVVIPRERQQKMNYARAPFAGICSIGSMSSL